MPDFFAISISPGPPRSALRGMDLPQPATLTMGVRVADNSIMENIARFIDNLGLPRAACCLRDFGRGVHRLDGTVIPARGGNGAHRERSVKGSQGAKLPTWCRERKPCRASNRRTVGQGFHKGQARSFGRGVGRESPARGWGGNAFILRQPEDRAMQGCNPSAELEAGAGGP
jgi:hypothetical protein